LKIHYPPFRSELERRMADLARTRPGAMIVHPDGLFMFNRRRIIEFAAAARIPAMYGFAEIVEEGRLMAYATAFADLYRRAVPLVDKILRGAKPSEIPVEQPPRFGLTVNLATAKALGLAIPRPVLLRADRLIE